MWGRSPDFLSRSATGTPLTNIARLSWVISRMVPAQAHPIHPDAVATAFTTALRPHRGVVRQLRGVGRGQPRLSCLVGNESGYERLGPAERAADRGPIRGGAGGYHRVYIPLCCQRCCSSASLRPPPATPRATNSTTCTWSPSPPQTATSPSAPPSPPGHRTILAAPQLPERVLRLQSHQQLTAEAAAL